MKRKKFAITCALAVIFAFGSCVVLSGAPDAWGMQASSTQNDSTIQAALQNSLKNSKFKNVRVAVQNGVVDLEGTVADFATKEDADKRAHRVKHVAAVNNNIQVAGAGEISDQQLQEKIVKQLQYDRVGYGNMFNAISVSVQNGVVTLGGHALGPVAADSAVSLASRTPGVQDVIDNIQVDPVSPMDNQLRLQVYRAVYGFPMLNKYAMNPAQPIRITVVNGHVILDGVVDRQADKDAAGIRAQTVSGVFSVTNNLQVANAPKEK